MSATHIDRSLLAGANATNSTANPEEAGRRGLILIQIDGLSREQLERSFAHGKAPFLRQLLKRQHYRLRTMYSGLPSTTPAVQGELFYGVPQAVPAFGYIPQGETESVMMNDAEQAALVEERLRAAGTALLRGGSAQSDIYTGGAAEPRFCAAVMGWGDWRQSARPVAVLLWALAYMGTLLRAFAQTLLEVGVALIDFIQAGLRGHWLRPELRIIWSRVVVDVLLRDAITSGACWDAERGLPVIHLNYLGYDEKSHCRGPSSRFAGRSLRGIDRSIRRLWRAARRAKIRDYEIWIYSDHGQAPAEPYERKYGRTLQNAIDAIWQNPPRADVAIRSLTPTQARARWFRGRPQSRTTPKRPATLDSIPPARAVAIGPLGYIYLDQPLADDQAAAYARRVVREAHVPLVAIRNEAGGTAAFTPQGEFRLPEQADQVFGDDHPFAQQAADDLVRLTGHPDAGQILVSGYMPGETTLTFVGEFGSHGGPGRLECQAFIIAPADAPLDWNDDQLVRPNDLREAAQRYLSATQGPQRPTSRRRTSKSTLRVMSYNVHACVGMDGRLAPERIARIIELCDVDMVALQELDVRRKRSGGVDQAEIIAALLDWEAYFHPALHMADEQYGDAILSRLPMQLIRAATLPGPARGDRGEPRGALWVEVDLGAHRPQLINTHLGLTQRDRAAQVDALLGPDWLGDPRCREPIILCGDLNAVPGSREYRRLSSRLRDVRRAVRMSRRGTFPSRFPVLSLDHVFVDGADVIAVELPESDLLRAASDHLPIIAELRLP